MNTNYCESPNEPSRRKTTEVWVGDTPLGGDNPIRVQTMATASTMDTEAVVQQCAAAARAGASYMRLTTQGTREAANLANIKAALRQRGISLPLIADVHFNPAAAMKAARHVDKVRINPGNFIDPRAKLQGATYTDEEYRADLQRIEAKLLELIELCRQRNVAIRVGVNHGSLSDRIMSRYGNTPQGMVESAMEFLRLFRQHGFEAVVVSMKSSSTRTMVQAVRLLVATMNAEGMHYPLHLGVTEAGDGEQGRIKSAVGIGALLADGIGDTIRVSLTEPPEAEIPVAQELVAHFAQRPTQPAPLPLAQLPYNPYSYSRRPSYQWNGLVGGDCPPVVVELTNDLPPSERADVFLTADMRNDDTSTFRLKTLADAMAGHEGIFVAVHHADLLYPATVEWLQSATDRVLVLSAHASSGPSEQRAAFALLHEHGIQLPAIIHRHYEGLNLPSLQLRAAADIGPLLLDGLGDGIMLTATDIDNTELCATAFGILQAAQVRISQPEYIACPGCGRTLYDLQNTLQRVRQATAHLKGLKIGVMGCIVNGPGEMADADYGYVGAAKGRISLYKGQTLVKHNIPEEQAIGELVELIKAHGDWREP